jgi:hypothetical protein
LKCLPRRKGRNKEAEASGKSKGKERGRMSTQEVVLLGGTKRSALYSR